MTETRTPYGHYGPPRVAAPDAALYMQYNIIARIDGFCVAVEDGRALLVDGYNMPHPVMDEKASDALLAAARLVDRMRDRWLRYGNLAGTPEAGGGEATKGE